VVGNTIKEKIIIKEANTTTKAMDKNMVEADITRSITEVWLMTNSNIDSTAKRQLFIVDIN
jgi:hypothetical protein